jgi:hypothetical protein
MIEVGDIEMLTTENFWKIQEADFNLMKITIQTVNKTKDADFYCLQTDIRIF